MIKVVLLGAGNVASHLANAFLKSDAVELVQMYNRSKDSLIKFENQIDTTTHLNNLAKADVYLIAIADDAIADFSNKLDLKDQLIAHTSGSVSMSSLSDRHRRAVFYPLQTFSINKEVNFKSIPICIETEYQKDLVLLERLAAALSDHVYVIDSEQRKYLHVAAVFANNFTNHLYYQAYQICQEHQVPFAILKPLIQETAKKIENLEPYKAQTGPAHRNDLKIIETHLKMLTKEQQDIYKLLTNSITKTYE